MVFTDPFDMTSDHTQDRNFFVRRYRDITDAVFGWTIVAASDWCLLFFTGFDANNPPECKSRQYVIFFYENMQLLF
uniref:Ion_trans domain-containing protein n=1 Tax=Panagrellus redivivus TaxID=6233 RepID=A0A7E4UNA3_PANRE